MNHIFLECSSNYGWRSTNDWWFIFYASNASPTKPVHAKTRPNDQSYSKMGKSTCKLYFVDNSRVSDQELKVYFRCQWQISDPECQWVNHLKVNIMCFYKKWLFFILVRGGQQQFKLTNTVRNVPSIDNGMVGMVQPAPQAPIPTVDGQEPLTSSMLAAANPQEQKQMLGERLFPLIQV